jgi:YaiO family outer membrane protein
MPRAGRRRPARSCGAKVTRTAALGVAVAAFAACARAADTDPQAVSAPAPEPWTLTTLYSHSWLSGGRPDWDTVDVRLLDQATPQLGLGVFVDAQRRPPDTDVGYGGSFSWLPIRTLEWRGAAMDVPGASFLPEQTYATGLEWRASALISLALDYRHQSFSEGPINQVTPAVTVWLSDDDATSLTVRYSRGRAFAAQDYDAYAIVFNAGMPGDGRLTLAFAHGTDPEKDPGIPGVILTTATSYYAYYRLPLRHGFDLIVGAEYEDRPGIYTRTTGTVGLNAKF